VNAPFYWTLPNDFDHSNVRPGRPPALESATALHNAFVTERRQLALDAITARPALIAELRLDPLLVELAGQPPQHRWRVRDPAVFPHLAPPAAFHDRHYDPVLVNIKPHIRYTIPTTRLLCMRLGIGQSGPTLATCIL
jgi:hypothetical protein